MRQHALNTQLLFKNAPTIHALTTQRTGGVSQAPFDSFNLSAAVGDQPDHVKSNHARLIKHYAMPNTPLWLNQTHSTHVVHSAHYDPHAPLDGIWTDQTNTVLTILTADCLPILLYQPRTQSIGACHAGWRGLVHGVIKNLMQAMPEPGAHTHAWIGPCIGAKHFKVQTPVAQALYDSIHTALPLKLQPYVDLKAIAKAQLQIEGIDSIQIDPRCTVTEHKTLFSYRGAPNQITGRMATCIWIAP